MPPLSSTHIATIVTLTEPFCRTENERRTLIDLLFAVTSSKPDIDINGAPLEFTRRLIFRLIDYGDIAPGTPALWALLEAIYAQVGFDKQAQIEALKHDIFTAVPTADYVLATEGGKLIFLSYATADSAFANRLRADLSAAGLNLWIDRLGLKVGTPNWEEAIRDALKRADGVLLIASPASRRSNFVRDELAIADDSGKPIYPVWASGDAWSDSIPLGRGYTQYVDLRGEKYAVGLKMLIEVLGGDSPKDLETPPPVPPNFVPRNPYKGLSAFRAMDRGDFFGREVFIAELLEQLRADPRALAVIGASGSGKSSVVMAGLLPRLLDGDLVGSASWTYLDPFVPGKHPIEALSIALAKHLPQKSQAAIDEDLLHPSTRGLYRLAKQISSTRLVLYIDQFEELFTQTEHEDERRQFIDLITTATHEADSLVTILLTLRADFYDRPLSYAELGALIETHSKAILPLTLADLYDVILKPAAQDDVRLTLETGLTEEMVFSVKGEAGVMPLLQFTLDQLVQRRDGLRLTRAAYDALGGVRGALAKHAEATYQTLNADGQKLARGLFLRLIEPGTTEQDTTRRRARLSEFILTDAAQNKRLSEIADTFVQSRLLTTDNLAGEDTIEVSHEALIREWTRLQGWLADARDDVPLMKRIAADAEDWRRQGPMESIYRGRRLRVAQDWAQRNMPSAVEEAFIAASVEAEQAQIAADELRKQELIAAGNRAEQQRLRARRTIRAAAIVIILGLILGGMAVMAAMNQMNLAMEARNDAMAQMDLAARAVQDSITQAAVARGAVVDAYATLTPIPITLNAASTLVAVANTAQSNAEQFAATALTQAANANSQLREAATAQDNLSRFADQAKTQVSQANATLTPIPITLTAIAQQIEDSTNLNTSLQMAVQANTVLQDPKADILAAVLLAIRGLKVAYTPQTDAALVKALDSDYARQGFVGHTSYVYSVAFSPDSHSILTGSGDGTVQLWDVDTGTLLRTFSGHTSYVYSVAFSPDGTSILTGSYDTTARLWDLDSGDLLYTFSGHADAVRSVAFSPDGTSILTGSHDDTARLWDAASGKILQIFDGHTGRVQSVAFSPDGRSILTGSDDKTARLWDVASGDALHTFSGHTSGVYSVAFSPDGRSILTGSDDNTARLWDVASGGVLHTFEGHTDAVRSVVFSPDGRSILTGSYDKTARLWDVDSGDLLWTFSGHTAAVNSVAFSPDGGSILTGSNDNTARLWSITPDILKTFSDKTDAVEGVAFAPDGRSVLTGSFDNSVRLWDITSGHTLQTFSDHTDHVWSVAFSPDGTSVLTGSSDGTARLWDIATGAILQTFQGHSGGVNSVAFSPDGTSILTGSWDNTARLWDVTSGTLLRTFNGHTSYVYSVAFSPDGKSIMTGSYDKTARLWDVASGGVLHTFEGHTDAVRSVAFSPDGNSILTGSEDKTARLWDIASGRTLQILSGHIGIVSSVVFSPDGRSILTGSHDSMARLWDSASGQLLRVFTAHTDSVRSVAFSPDGSFILTGSLDTTTRLWNTDYRDFMAFACAHVWRDFTFDERQRFGIVDDEPTCPQFANRVTDYTYLGGTPGGTPSPVFNGPLTTPMPPTTTPFLVTVTLPVWTPIASPTASSTPIPTLIPTETPGG